MKNIIRILLGAFVAILAFGACLCFGNSFEAIDVEIPEAITETEEIVTTKYPLEENSPNCRLIVETTTTVVTTTTTEITTTITTTITKTTTAEYLVFNSDSKRVHRSSCEYADNSMEKIVGNSIEFGRKCEACNPEVFFDEEYVEPTEEKRVSEDSITEQEENNSMSCSGTFQATYYCGNAGVTYGAAGRTLQSGYSCASNYFAMGTILYIESDYFPSGYYRVDDRGGMANNVLDMYYGYGCVPSDFAWSGRVNVTVYVVD